MNTYGLLRRALFAIPPETAHELTLAGGSAIADTPVEGLLARQLQVTDPRLETELFGETFSNPVGVAAGFDKNAKVPGLLGSVGFGHVEVGGVTAHAQPGNPRPRLFRLSADEALINRLGFNNEGADRIGTRLARATADVPIGVNLGKSKGVPAELAPADYRYTYERMADGGDFFVVNVSSPNTPGLRDLQQRDQLTRIVDALQAAGAAPLLVKLSPDLSEPAAADVIDLVEERGLDGIVATNTTTHRPPSLRDPRRAESGGLSGRPLGETSTRWIRFVAERTDIPVVGVGGVFTAHDAYRKLRAGASLVQLYTGLVYRGPTIARSINRGLLELLERDGFASVNDCVGADLD